VEMVHAVSGDTQQKLDVTQLHVEYCEGVGSHCQESGTVQSTTNGKIQSKLAEEHFQNLLLVCLNGR